VRQRDGQWFIGPDAFFFEEGTGDQYESARYGEFRLQEDGSTLLVGLRDEAFTPGSHPPGLVIEGADPVVSGEMMTTPDG
jgi:hypothetical protein